MPRPVRAFGRPGTAVFPPSWDTDHAQVIGATHTATVAVGSRSTVATWSDETNQMETAQVTPVYAGAASVSIVSLGGAAAEVDAADDLVAQRKYQVTLPREIAGILADHVVRVTTCSDADLLGKTLTIDGVELGSSRFARHLICTLI
ncbi:MAG: hypothetical protein JWQ74_447 [Marmoricola sp.]|nr:hypothetical protein [Marmoricola sp.]